MQPGTTHGDAFIHCATEALVDPAWAVLLADVMTKLNRGDHYSRPYVDILLQPWRHNAYDIFDAYAFMLLHSSLCNREVGMVAIHVGTTPYSDKCTEENNQALSRIARPFKATFLGGLGDCDGELSWPVTVHVNACITPEATDAVVFELPPGVAPLEVGYTEGSKTLEHLHHGCIARWPYGSDKVWLLAQRDDRPLIEPPSTSLLKNVMISIG